MRDKPNMAYDVTQDEVDAIQNLRGYASLSFMVDPDVIKKVLDKINLAHAAMPIFDPTAYRDEFAPVSEANTKLIQAYLVWRKAAEAFLVAQENS